MDDVRLSTVAPFGFAFDPERFMRAFSAMGCDGAQVYRRPGAFELADASDMRDRVEACGLRVESIHGRFGTDIDPSGPDDAHREQCLKVYEGEARLARALGADAVVVHPAANLPLDEAFRPVRRYSIDEAETLQEARLPWLRAFASGLGRIGEREHVTFLLENVPRHFPIGHTPAVLADVVRAVASDRLRMCFDTGHAHETGDVVQALRDCANVIGYVHLHDGIPAAHSHLLPGDGSIDWPGVIDALHTLTPSVRRMVEVFVPEGDVEGRAHDRALLDRLGALARR